MELMRVQQVRFIAINSGIDSADPNTLEFAPFINIMSEWYAKDISKKVKTGIKTKGMSGKPIMTEAPYGYLKDQNQKDYWQIDEPAAEVIRLIYSLFMAGKNRNQICIHLREKQIPTPTFHMKDQDRGTAKNKLLNEANRFKWNKASLTHILTRQEYCSDVVNFKTRKHFKDKKRHYVDESEWVIFENTHEPIIDQDTFDNVQRIRSNMRRYPDGWGEAHPLTGLLYCADCGGKMYVHRTNNGKRIAQYTCSQYSKVPVGELYLTQHRINAEVVLTLIADMLRAIAEYSKNDRAEFIKAVTDVQETQQTSDIKAACHNTKKGFRTGNLNLQNL